MAILPLSDIETSHRSSFFGGKKKSTSWVEETAHIVRASQDYTDAEVHFGTQFSRRHLFFIIVFFVLLFGGLLMRIGYIQLVRGKQYAVLAEGNRSREVAIPAERGLIYDRNGVPLTKNIPKLSLVIVPQYVPRDQETRKQIAEKLSTIVDRTPEEIVPLLNEYTVLKEDVEYDTALSIYIDAADLPGVQIERGSKRLYVVPDAGTGVPVTSSVFSLSHILGYESKISKEELLEKRKDGYLLSDFIGKTGLEKSYEPYVRGTYGRRQLEVNTFGREQSVISEISPVPGQHLELTIDSEVQAMLEQLLKEGLEKAKRNSGVAIVMNPQNGEILAMVSLPSFDNNDFSGGISSTTYQGYATDSVRPLFHRAISGMYPSGSTLKPAIASAALQEGIINERTTFLSNGGLRVGQWFFPDWQSGGHGTTDVRKSLAQSVNTFYYYIGGGFGNFTGLGVEKIGSYLRRFGFGNQLGIDIPGEAAGFIPSKEWKENTKKEKWYIGDTYNMSIGQGDVLVTPLQIATMTGAVANNGTVYRPHLVRATIDPVSGKRHDMAPEIDQEAHIDASHLRTVQAGMRDCVVSGSCRRLASVPIAIAGKTGTAQWNSFKENHAWFTSFAPAESPEIVVTILIEEGGEGSRTAVPVADAFYRWWAARER